VKKITIIIVDDHRLIRETWTYFINTDPRFKVIGECASGEEALQVIPQINPDIVIMDINLPGMNGIQVTQALNDIATFTSKVLAVSLHTQSSYTKQMLLAGARGYVTKNSSKQEMFEALATIHAGDIYICNEIRKNITTLDPVLNVAV
jgi:two-component system invasion response regulator UvrY